MKKPFAGKFKLTQEFGVSYWYNNKKRKHLGIDWALPNLTPILAPFDGVVSRVEKYRMDGYGRSVYLRSSDSQYEALHAHLESINVEVGNHIKEGEIMGLSGRSGFVRGPTGYHLHWGLKKGGFYVNPLEYLESDDQLKIPVKDDKAQYIDAPKSVRGDLSAREYWAKMTGKDKKDYPVPKYKQVILDERGIPEKKQRYITEGYIVKKGDTLWGIAEEFYGDGNLWKKIFDANNATISHQDKIAVGQVIKIPGFE